MENIIDQVTSHVSSTDCMNHLELARDIEGFTSHRVKCLLNRLVSHLPPDEGYLEIGCYKGATFVSALTGNHPAKAYACDDWSEYQSRDAFMANIEAHKSAMPPFELIDGSCFEMDLGRIAAPIGVYFYDGDHNAEAQSMAITHFWPALADKAIIIIDDWNWGYVRFGTYDGLDVVQPSVRAFRELPARYNGDKEMFHNGIGLFYVEK